MVKDLKSIINLVPAHWPVDPSLLLFWMKDSDF